jgi:hypothetical protein
VIETIGGLVGLGITLPLWYAYRVHQLKGRVRTILRDRVRARGLTLAADDDGLRVPKSALLPGGSGPLDWSVEIPGPPAVSAYQPHKGNAVFGWKATHAVDGTFWLGSEHPPPAKEGDNLSDFVVRGVRENRLRLLCTPDAARALDSTQLVSTFVKLFPFPHWQLVYERGHLYLYACRVGSADLQVRLRGIPELDAALAPSAQRRA